MNKQDMLKIQTCVLRVNIHCEGCKHKIKKKLQKVEGVYKVSIDVEQGKVTVSGNVDPVTLIETLEKAGKHAELWGAQKGPISILNNQFKDIQIGNINGGKNSKAQKGGKNQQKNGIQAPPQQMHQKKGLKDERFLGKDQKSVRFNLPEDEDDDDFDDFDEFDEDDDEFDDELDEGFAAHQPPSKVAHVGLGPQAKKATPNGHVKGNNGANNGGKGKKGGGINMFLKGMLGKAGGKNGNVGKSFKKGENKKENGSKNSKKNGGFALGDGKNGAKNGKGAAHNSNGGGKTNDGWSKKARENFDGGPKLEFNEINANHKGGGGRNMDLMGQMGSFPAVQGLPAGAAAAMNVGRFQGVGQGNPYNQQYIQGVGQGNPYNQQYMAHMMMMMNQQRENGHGAYNPLAYMGPQPAMNYGPPPPPNDQYTHIFSDENTDSCSIM